MTRGYVSDDGTPYIRMLLAGQEWPTVVDTGFNGHLELPLALKTTMHPTFFGRSESILAGGQRIVEDVYVVEVHFDAQAVQAYVAFVDSNEILLGTAMLSNHHLEIDFPARRCVITRRDAAR